jgi:glutathione S-transferase
MALTLYYHPLSSFCWKALIALYENQTPFTPLLVDFGNEESRGALFKVWPMGEFPVLQDREKNQIVPQSSVLIEYLHLNYPGAVPLIPADPNQALEARRWNEFFDTYIHVHMQKIVADVMRPDGKKDPVGVDGARDMILTAYGVLEDRLKDRTWAAGETFTMADCAAYPALFYGNKVAPFEKKHPSLTRYFARLKQRPSCARVLEEAQPYMHYFPYKGEELDNK